MADLEVTQRILNGYKPALRRPWTPEGLLFLPEALILLGKSRFGDDWTGEELSARRGAGEPPQPPAEPKADEPLKVRQPDGTTRAVDRPVRWVVNGEAQIIPYAEALQIYENEKDELLERWRGRCEAYDRFQETWNELRQVLFSKRITAVVLDKHGFITQVPTHEWSSAEAMKLLESGKASFSVGDSYFPNVVSGGVLVIENDLKVYLSSDDISPTEIVAETVGKSDQIEPINTKAEAPKVNRGGRPAKWEWEDCLVEIFRIVHLYGLPESQAEMVRTLQDWFISHVSDAPAESEIKKRVSKVFRAIREAENSEDT